MDQLREDYVKCSVGSVVIPAGNTEWVLLPVELPGKRIRFWLTIPHWGSDFQLKFSETGPPVVYEGTYETPFKDGLAATMRDEMYIRHDMRGAPEETVYFYVWYSGSPDFT